jgi:outer membrane autotransporter protein
MKTQLITGTQRTAVKLPMVFNISVAALLISTLPGSAQILTQVFIGPTPTPPFSFATYAATVCKTPNHIAEGGALDSAISDPRASGLMDVLLPVELEGAPTPELCRDLELLNPEALAAIYNINVSLANVESANLERRMDDIHTAGGGFTAMNESDLGASEGLAGPSGPDGKSGKFASTPPPADNRWGIFLNGLGEFTTIDDTAFARGYNLSSGGFILGGDYRVCPNFAIGLTGGYAHSNASLPNNGNIDVDGGKFGIYATAFDGGLYGDFAVIGGLSGYDTRRTALLGDANGSTSGEDVTTLVSTGYDWQIGSLSIGPTASFQFTYTGFDSFTESGSVAPLAFPDQHTESTRSALGAKASYDFKVGTFRVTPELRTAWQHEYSDTSYPIVSQFASGAGNSFTVNSPSVGRDSLLISAGFAIQLTERLSLYAYYDGEVAQTNYLSNNVSAGIRLTF